jgi:hypothetical protein
MKANIKVHLAWAALVIAILASTGPKWLSFGPVDYEECAEHAAKDAKSGKALDVLLSSCASTFRGRRKLGGGYSYYDSLQQRSFDIAGSNPTAAEMEYIKSESAAYLIEQREAAAAEAEYNKRLQQVKYEQKRKMEDREQAAAKNVEVTLLKIECRLSFSCSHFDLTVRVINRSKENISELSVGWAFVPKQDKPERQDLGTCPSSIRAHPVFGTELVRLHPGDTAIVKFSGIDGPNSSNYSVCTKVNGVRIAADEPQDYNPGAKPRYKLTPVENNPFDQPTK